VYFFQKKRIKIKQSTILRIAILHSLTNYERQALKLSRNTSKLGPLATLNIFTRLTST